MRLDAGKQHAFLSQLAAKGVNLAMLPIVRQERQAGAAVLCTIAPVVPVADGLGQRRLQHLGDGARARPASCSHAALQQAFDVLLVRHSALSHGVSTGRGAGRTSRPGSAADRIAARGPRWR